MSPVNVDQLKEALSNALSQNSAQLLPLFETVAERAAIASAFSTAYADVAALVEDFFDRAPAGAVLQPAAPVMTVSVDAERNSKGWNYSAKVSSAPTVAAALATLSELTAALDAQYGRAAGA